MDDLTLFKDGLNYKYTSTWWDSILLNSNFSVNGVSKKKQENKMIGHNFIQNVILLKNVVLIDWPWNNRALNKCWTDPRN